MKNQDDEQLEALLEAVQAVLDMFEAAFSSFKPREGAVSAWMTLCAGFEPDRIVEAAHKLCLEPREFAPTPGQVLTEATIAANPSLRACAADAFERAAYRGPGPRSLEAQVAIDCGVLRCEGGHWYKSAGGAARQAEFKRFETAWNAIRTSPMKAREQVRRLEAKNHERLVEGKMRQKSRSLLGATGRIPSQEEWRQAVETATEDWTNPETGGPA